MNHVFFSGSLSDYLVGTGFVKFRLAYTDGILRIDIAKREEAKMVRRQIEIK
ncbi:hypothetical protein ABIB30_003341 [Pedobacter sp. UYP1]